MLFSKLEFVSNFSQGKPKMYVYDPKTEKLSLRCEVPVGDGRFAVALMNKRLIFLGESYHWFIRKTCYYFDLGTLKSSTIAPMKIGRLSLGATVVKGHLYAVGGEGQWGGDDCIEDIDYDLDSVERFECKRMTIFYNTFELILFKMGS